MKWIRRKLRKWLGIEFIESQIADIKADILTLDAEIKIDRHNNNMITKKHEEQMHVVQSYLQVAVDVHNPMHQCSNMSWAVICIKGKADYVRFVNLGHKEIRDISRFIRQFETNNTMVDFPYGMDQRLIMEL